MFSFLKGIGLRPLDWDELVSLTNSAAPFVGDVLTEAFGTAQAVVVLFTPDDEAKIRDEFLQPDDEDHERDLTRRLDRMCCSKPGWRSPATQTPQSLSSLAGSGLSRTSVDATRSGSTAAQRNCEVSLSAWRRRAATSTGPRRTRTTRVSSPVPLYGGAPRAVPRRRSASTVAREVGYLKDDARRWIADRDRQLSGEMSQRSGQVASQGMTHSGAHLASHAILRRNALHEYRDEISRKRRDYAKLLDDAPPEGIPRFELDEASLATLARWRSPVTVTGVSGSTEVDDPTGPSREPDLRRFEEEGDGPDTIQGAESS